MYHIVKFITCFYSVKSALPACYTKSLNAVLLFSYKNATLMHLLKTHRPYNSLQRSTAILLLAFIFCGWIFQSLHNHQHQLINGSKGKISIAANCPICDYVLNKQSAHAHFDAVFTDIIYQPQIQKLIVADCLSAEKSSLHSFTNKGPPCLV